MKAGCRPCEGPVKLRLARDGTQKRGPPFGCPRSHPALALTTAVCLCSYCDRWYAQPPFGAASHHGDGEGGTQLAMSRIRRRTWPLTRPGSILGHCRHRRDLHFPLPSDPWVQPQGTLVHRKYPAPRSGAKFRDLALCTTCKQHREQVALAGVQDANGGTT
jgi:hypothetical protein